MDQIAAVQIVVVHRLGYCIIELVWHGKAVPSKPNAMNYSSIKL